MEDYFIKTFGKESYLCTRNIQVGDILKECFPDNIERKVHHFETVLPYGIYVFEPWPAEKEIWLRADQAFKVVGNLSEVVELLKKENDKT